MADDLAQGYNNEEAKMARTQNKAAASNRSEHPNQQARSMADARSEMGARQGQNEGAQRYVDIEDEQLKIENQSAL